MAVTMNIYYYGDKSNAADFAKEMMKSGIVSEIRKKKGNFRYEYFVPMDDVSYVLLIDKWEDQRALDEHHASDIMQKISDLREKYSLTMKVERYVEDESQISDNDKKFIVERR